MTNQKFTQRQMKVLKCLREQTFCDKDLSGMYQGAIIVKESNENPERIYQAAHSLRELTFYMTLHIKKSGIKEHIEQMKEFFNGFDDLGGMVNEAIIKQWHDLHGYFVQLCHHHSNISNPEEFEENLYKLESIILSIYGPIIDSINKLEELIENDNKIKSEEIDLDLIEMNYSEKFLIYICRIIFFRKKAIILKKDDFLNNLLTKLLNYLTEDSFNYDILFYSKEKYKSLKKSYSDYVVLEENKIINNPPGFLSKIKNRMKKQTKIEHYLVSKYLALRSYEFALQVFRKEIHTIYLLAGSIARYATEIKDEEKINIYKIKEILKAKNKNSEYDPYIDYLIEISRNYFGAKLPYIFSTVINSI